MSPPAPLRYPRISPAEARALVAKHLGTLVHPANQEGTAQAAIRQYHRQYQRRRAIENLKKGLRSDGKPRVRRRLNSPKGLGKDHNGYMRWWRSNAQVKSA